MDKAMSQRILSSCPSAGDGVNRWLFTAARQLHRLGVDPNEMEALIEEATQDCGRDVRPEEIERAVKNSAPGAISNGPRRRAWPRRNYEQIEAIGLNGLTLSALEEASPVVVDETKIDSEAVIDALFPGDPLICAGSDLRFTMTRTREEWRGFMARQQFIVPSAMSKRKGRTKEGKLSFRSDDNVGPRQFALVEFDFSETNQNGFDTDAAPTLRELASAGVTVADLCASIHAHLAKLRPLALVVHSGNRSLHGWYPCLGDDDAEVLRFMRYAVSVGADPATWTRVQLVRMPGGLRENGNRQRVHYFNPAVIGGAK